MKHTNLKAFYSAHNSYYFLLILFITLSTVMHAAQSPTSVGIQSQSLPAQHSPSSHNPVPAINNNQQNQSCCTIKKNIFRAKITATFLLVGALGTFGWAIGTHPPPQPFTTLHITTDYCNDRCPEGVTIPVMCVPPFSFSANLSTIKDQLDTLCQGNSSVKISIEESRDQVWGKSPGCESLEEHITKLNKTCGQPSLDSIDHNDHHKLAFIKPQRKRK